MILNLEVNEKIYRFDTSEGKDISIAIKDKGELNAYYLGDAEFRPFSAGNFIGDVQQGGSVNCFDVFFNPHGNGTHTESIGHIREDRLSINSIAGDSFSIAHLLSVEPVQQENGDKVIDVMALENKINPIAESLVIRTLPNIEAKRAMRYSGSNPPYLTPEAAQFIADSGIKNLIVDLPSLDREEDEGKLKAHRAFWRYDSKQREQATITELVYIPDTVLDGIHVLNLQVAPFELDASPSRPVLYPLKDYNE